VTLELNDTSNSKSILYKSKYSYFILHEHEGCYDLKLSKQQIPVMIADLTRAGAEVLRIDYRNQLEDYFLKITANS
jgi:hypothetical protein